MRMFASLDRFFYWIGQNGLLNSDAEQQCQLRAPLDDTTFTTTADGFVSFIRLLGNRKVVGPREFEEACEALTQKLRSYLKVGTGRQHSFGFAALTDPDSAAQYTRTLIQPLYATGKRYGITSPAIFNDIHGAVSALAIEDYAVLVVMTHPEGLTSDERQRMKAWREDASRKHSRAGTYDEDFTQTPRINGPALIPRHKQLVTLLKHDLENPNGKIKVLADILNVDDAGRMLRRFIDRDGLPSRDWRLRLLGDGEITSGTVRKKDLSHLLPMRIGRQLVTSSVREIFDDVEAARAGDWYYASVVMEMPPEMHPTPTFAELDERIGRTLPWSVNFELLPNGLSFNTTEKTFASVLGAFGEHNKRILNGFVTLKAMQEGGESIVALRAIFRTWAKTQDKLFERVSFLRLAVQGWGSCVATNETGAPGLAHFANVPGFAKRSVAPYMGAPLSHVIRMMPLSRSASVWSRGGLILRTEEGQPYPVALGSTMQTYWGMTLLGPPGLGKSALMNCINRGNLFAPGLEELPYITLIDVGMSGTGIVRLAHCYLPPHLARQVVSIRIRNSTEFAVNPFDTQLGCPLPTENQRDFLVAILGTVCQGLGPDSARFLGLVVDETFRNFAPGAPGAVRFQRAFNDEVNAAIDEIGFVPDEHTTVWEVTTALFKAGKEATAWVSHRYAMPTLGKLTQVVGQPTVTNLYGSAKTPSGEPLIDVFKRNIAAALSEFQMISTTTRYDVGDARIVVIDLEEIAGASKSEEGRRRTAVMFLFARQLGAGNYFLRWKEIEAVVLPEFKEYQERRVKRMWQQLKFLAYDEFHNASGIPSLLALVEADLRQGRKYQVVAMMSSQFLEDFPEAVVAASNTYFILGTGSGIGVKEIQRTFGLTDSEAHVIETKLTGPDPIKGAPLFAYFKTVRGPLSQLLYNSMGPIEMWCYTSSGVDDSVRGPLVERLGLRPAIEFLARRFPRDGDARRFIDAEKLRMSSDAPDKEKQLFDQIVERLIEEAAKEMASGVKQVASSV
jgi:intracellular multiplication protein IcmB